MKYQMLIDDLQEISTDLENLRLRTCYWYGNCAACPCNLSEDPAGICALSRMVTAAEDVIDKCENEED